MARTKSSSQWLQEHVNDPYVKQAQRDGYRSRASYKLIQLNEKDKLIRPGMLIVDLGSAPGGWSQVVGRLAGDQGRIVATDILPMDPLKNVEFLQGDFTDEAEYLGRLRAAVADVVARQRDTGIDLVNDGEFGHSMGMKVQLLAPGG